MKSLKSMAIKTARGRRAERGAALIVVVTILLILTLLGITVLNRSRNDYSLSYNRIYTEHAAQLATSGMNLFIQKFFAKDTTFRTAIIDNPKLFQMFRDGTFTLDSQGEFSSTTPSTPHRAFDVNSFLPKGAVPSKGAPPIFGEFSVRVVGLYYDPYQNVTAGMGIGSGPFAAKRCDYIATFVATGRIVDPRQPRCRNVVTGATCTCPEEKYLYDNTRTCKLNPQYLITERSYRVQLKLSDLPCPFK